MGRFRHRASNSEAAGLAGVVAATPIATPGGWRPAVNLRAGDAVLTSQSGVQILRHLVQMVPDRIPAPLFVPPWALDNRDALRLLPDQLVLIEADLAEVLYGDPFALIPTAALEGWRGISRAAPHSGEVVVQLGFDEAQVIYASRAVLLSCPSLPHEAASPLIAPKLAPVSYSLPQARHLIACLMAEEVGGALRASPQPQAAAF